MVFQKAMPPKQATSTPAGSPTGGLGRTPGPHPPAAGQAAVGPADQAPVKAGCRTYGDHVELPGGRQLLRLLSRRQTWLPTSRRQPIGTRPAANISHGTSTTRSAAVKLASFATGATGSGTAAVRRTRRNARQVKRVWRRHGDEPLRNTSHLHGGFTLPASGPVVMEATPEGFR